MVVTENVAAAGLEKSDFQYVDAVYPEDSISSSVPCSY